MLSLAMLPVQCSCSLISFLMLIVRLQTLPILFPPTSWGLTQGAGRANLALPSGHSPGTQPCTACCWAWKPVS